MRFGGARRSGCGMRPDRGSLPLLRRLHERVFGCPEVRGVLAAAFEELDAELKERFDPPHAACVIPVELFAADGLPRVGEPVRLCRLFLLRRGARMAAPERHRNSVQRLVSYQGRGRIHQGTPGGGPLGLEPREIGSPVASGSPGGGCPDDVDIVRCWDIVPAGVWHYPEAGGGRDWATVTFHSAGEDEIVDEVWAGS